MLNPELKRQELLLKKQELNLYQLFVITVTVIFVAVMLLNVLLMFNIASDQTEEIGRMRLQNIAAGLQKSLTRAENTLDRVSSELVVMLENDASYQEIRAFLSEQR